jgi:hypothetical protein
LLYVKGSKAARYKVLKIIVLLSIQGEEKERKMMMIMATKKRESVWGAFCCRDEMVMGEAAIWDRDIIN